jgi:hypothetical protein
VIGPSGSGKSSLVYAGLLPELGTSKYFDEGFWLVGGARRQSSSLMGGINLAQTRIAYAGPDVRVGSIAAVGEARSVTYQGV